MTPLVLVARPATGGLRSHLVSFLGRLDQAKWDIHLAGPTSLLDSLPLSLPHYKRLPLAITAQPSPADLAAVLVLLRNLSAIREQAGAWPIVHAHGIRAAGIAALAHIRTPLPFLATLHNIPPSGLRSSAVLRFISHHADRIICVSNAIAARTPGRQKLVIPNGIDLNRFANLDRSEARRRFGIEENAFTVAAAARLSSEKGIDVLLEAAKSCPEMVFLIAGSGPDEHKLKAIAPANVRFLGRVEEIPTLFAASDAVAVPSRSEGQGIAALEAMAAGAPVVASSVGGLPEMIEDRVNGLLIPPASPGPLREALCELRGDSALRIRLGEAGKAYAQAHGDVDRMIAAIEAVYADVTRETG